MQRKRRLLIFMAVALCSAFAAGPELPPGSAKAMVESKCKQCHDLKKIVEQHQDANWWAGTLERMKTRGLELEPDEEEMVLKYLVANFGTHPSKSKTSH